jgi:hypothetical protein
MRLKIWGLLWCLAWGCHGSAQAAQRDLLAESAAVVEALQASGTRSDRPRAVVYFEGGLVSAAEQASWADRISEGIDNIEKLLKASFGETKLEYYVSSRVTETSYSILGYSAPPRTFLASDRVRRGAAPYLHEAVHHLVFRLAVQRSDGEPHFWAFEGFPSYVEDAVVTRFGGVAGRVFVAGGNETVDDEARAALGTAQGRRVLEFIGRVGVPSGMEDRQNVAKPFYVLAQSLTKHLIETVGLDAFVWSLVPHLLNAPGFEWEVQRLSGKSLDRLVAEWREKIERPGATRSTSAPEVK